MNGRLIGHIDHLQVRLISAFEDLGVPSALALSVPIFESLLADLKPLLDYSFFLYDQALTVMMV